MNEHVRHSIAAGEWEVDGAHGASSHNGDDGAIGRGVTLLDWSRMVTGAPNWYFSDGVHAQSHTSKNFGKLLMNILARGP
jgi:hypothetical protein